MRKAAYNKLKKHLLAAKHSFIDRSGENVMLATEHMIVSIPYADYEGYVADDTFPALNDCDYYEHSFEVDKPFFTPPVKTNIRMYYEKYVLNATPSLAKIVDVYPATHGRNKIVVIDTETDIALINKKFYDAVTPFLGKAHVCLGASRRDPVIMHDGDWRMVVMIMPINYRDIADRIVIEPAA